MPLLDASLTGGSDIISYNLQYDEGAIAGSGTNGESPEEGDFVSLVGEVPDNNIDVLEVTLSGLSTDTIYSFRYRVKNKHGWSGFSDTLGVLTATVPAGMSAPSFSIPESSPTSAVITWTIPYNGGNSITAYTILLENDDGSDFFEELDYCDGSALVTITALTCTIPLVTLRAAPFNLALD